MPDFQLKREELQFQPKEFHRVRSLGIGGAELALVKTFGIVGRADISWGWQNFCACPMLVDSVAKTFFIRNTCKTHKQSPNRTFPKTKRKEKNILNRRRTWKI
jgi:hypothetical protein